MRADEVPQDPSFYKGIERVCFAVDGERRYVPAKSAGWEVERLATEQALERLEEEVEAIRQRVLRGELSPLAYHVATRQMTPKLFAQHAGVRTWRAKRHLKPRPFVKLSAQVLKCYADCLGLPIETLQTVPNERVRVFFEDTGD